MSLTSDSHTHYTGLDALRVLAMFLIVMLHVLSVGGILQSVQPGYKNYLLVWILRIVSAVGVNCFGLLSGWLGVYSQHKWKSIRAIWLQAAFWSLGCYLLSWCWSQYAPCGGDVLHGLMPVTFGSWWYFSSYFLLFFAMPYLNLAVRQNIPPIWGFLCIMGICLMGLPLISSNFTIATEVGNGVVWLGYLYVLGAALRLNEDRLGRFHWWLLLVGWSVGTLGSIFALSIKTHLHGDIVFGNNSPFVLLSSVSLLLLFARLKVKRGATALHLLSALTFSVYIIHFHPRFRTLFMSERFTWLADLSEWKCFVGVVGITAGIYLACSLLDLGRYCVFNFITKARS